MLRTHFAAVAAIMTLVGLGGPVSANGVKATMVTGDSSGASETAISDIRPVMRPVNFPDGCNNRWNESDTIWNDSSIIYDKGTVVAESDQPCPAEETK